MVSVGVESVRLILLPFPVSRKAYPICFVLTVKDTEALSIHDCKPPGLSRRSCEPHAGRRLFARNAGWHIRQEHVVRASPDADDRISAKTEGEGVIRHLDFYRLRPCLFLKFDAGYGMLLDDVKVTRVVPVL